MFLHEPEKWINKEGNNKLVDNIINGFKPEDSEEDRLDRLEILRALIDGGAKLKIENPENPTETDVMKAIIGGDMETLSNLKDKPILNKTLNLLTEKHENL